MIETIITASVLILIVVAVRQVLHNHISARLQYALWLLVAVRLLLPFSLFESPVSVLRALPEVRQNPTIAAQPAAPINPSDVAVPGSATDGQTEITPPTPAVKPVDCGAIARTVWLCGLVGSVLFWTACNLRLRRMLATNRMRLERLDYALPVYLVDALPSPCLYGLLRPAIYLTPESLASEHRTAHILVHEQTHRHHGDHIWAFVRVLCLCVHWFNPLVWLAANLSRRDSELACDEAALNKLDAAQRTEYGRTLIEMVGLPTKPTAQFYCATAMSGGKGEMTERIQRIAKRPKMLAVTLVVVVAVATLAVACTFGGSRTRDIEALPYAQQLWNARVPYVGDNARVGKLIGLLPLPEGVQYDHFVLHTEAEPYKLEIVYTTSAETLRLYDTAENPAEIVKENSLLLLALVDNVDQIYNTLTDGHQKVRLVYGRQWADYLVDGDVREFAKSADTVQELLGLDLTELDPMQYSMAKLGREGTVLAEYAVRNDALAKDIVLDALVKSAAWPGVDIATLDECYLLVQTLIEVGETREFYAYRMEDGSAVLQFGLDGMRTMLSEELYTRLVARFEGLPEPATPRDLRPMLLVEGKIYMDTNRVISLLPGDFTAFGKITSTVDAAQKPTENGQSNFGAVGAKYAFYEEHLVVLIQDQWILFESSEAVVDAGE